MNLLKACSEPCQTSKLFWKKDNSKPLIVFAKSSFFDYCVCLQRIALSNSLSICFLAPSRLCRNIGELGVNNILQTSESLIQFSYLLPKEGIRFLIFELFVFLNNLQHKGISQRLVNVATCLFAYRKIDIDIK